MLDGSEIMNDYSDEKEHRFHSDRATLDNSLYS